LESKAVPLQLSHTLADLLQVEHLLSQTSHYDPVSQYPSLQVQLEIETLFAVVSQVKQSTVLVHLLQGY